VKCDEYVTKTIKGRTVRRRCKRNAMDGETKCYGHLDELAYDGNQRLAPGNYGRIGRLLVSADASAQEVKATRLHVMRVLKGEIQPSWGFAQRLAAACGVTLDELAKHLKDVGGVGGGEWAKALKEIDKRRRKAAA